MTKSHLAGVSVVLAALAAACGSNAQGGDPKALIGTWVDAVNSQGSAGTETLTFDAGGTATATTALTEEGGVSCTGSYVFSGITWSATATTLTFSGNATCTGTLQCGTSNPIPCDQGSSPAAMSGGVPYSLSNGNDTLVIHDPSGTDLTFTRKQ
jgi:hypothetical protein